MRQEETRESEEAGNKRVEAEGKGKRTVTAEERRQTDSVNVASSFPPFFLL